MNRNNAVKVACCAAAVAALAFVLRGKGKDDQKKDDPAPAALDAVGGHGSKKDKGPPILVKDNMIFKPFQPAQKGKGKSRGELEADFYKNVTETNHPIKPFIPSYHGRETLNGNMYLKLENLTHGLNQPCVLDLKMGQRTYDETASPEKQERERKKYPPQEIIGFRIVGMKVVRPGTGELWKSSREWCMSITPESMRSAIDQFFFDGRVFKHELMQELIQKLNEIEAMLLSSPTWRMYGSSLLVVYDAAPSAGKPKILVKMIDFAHIFEIKDGGQDDGYLHGIGFLKQCLQRSLEEANASHGQNQVGGAHGNISSRGGELVKKEDKPDLFDVEVAFYRKAWESTPRDALSKVMPKLIRVNEQSKPRELVISDAAALVRDPRKSALQESVSIMDIKLGERSFSADCPNDPKESYYSKYAEFENNLSPGRAEDIWKLLIGSKHGPDSLRFGKLGKRDYLRFRDATTTSQELGFRLTALVHGDYRVSQADSRSIETRVKFLESLERYLYNEKGFDANVATSFVKQLNEVLEAAKDSDLFYQHDIVGSSLLFLHCNGRTAIRWIDFANSVPPAGQDLNKIPEGIQRLTLAFEELISKNR